MELIDIKELMDGKLTYPSWSTKTRYSIQCEIKSDRVRVYYVTTKTLMKKVHERLFPRFIKLTPRFCWAMGFLKGEGLNSINGKSYYRFEITNKNPYLLNKVIEELDTSRILKKEDYPKKCFQIFHSSNERNVVKNYWSTNLDFDVNKFEVINCKSSLKKSDTGICHLYISDVLLRRVVDEINMHITDQIKNGV
ncbi:hypothetical protein FJZ53_00505 [Candidatus Woesearchaeota archaeon]|nr:hypothetical protein [Candidatus Woesearchaeota archaeon]